MHNLGRMPIISTHSRAKAAGSRPLFYGVQYIISTHSRAKAAGFGGFGWYRIDIISTHSRAKAAGIITGEVNTGIAFQLTAARRRLGPTGKICAACGYFNSQPREGGWLGD